MIQTAHSAFETKHFARADRRQAHIEQLENGITELAAHIYAATYRLLGAELLEVEDEMCPLFPTEGACGVVKSMVESVAFNGKYVSPNQYENKLNIEAEYLEAD